MFLNLVPRKSKHTVTDVSWRKKWPPGAQRTFIRWLRELIVICYVQRWNRQRSICDNFFWKIIVCIFIICRRAFSSKLFVLFYRQINLFRFHTATTYITWRVILRVLWTFGNSFELAYLYCIVFADADWELT